MGKKSRKILQKEYEEKYSDIPRDYQERLLWMYDKYHISEKKAQEILEIRQTLLSSMVYDSFTIVLYEEPVGAERPRVRIMKSNVIDMARMSPANVHIYSPHAKENNMYMRRVIDDMELEYARSLICTPCMVDFYAYKKTPSNYNITKKFLAEMGLDRPVNKPDWDNIGKAYSDMYNANVWIDDALTTDGAVHKYYSLLPRVEIKLSFLNSLYNQYQYEQITGRKDFDPETMHTDYFKY